MLTHPCTRIFRNYLPAALLLLICSATLPLQAQTRVKNLYLSAVRTLHADFRTDPPTYNSAERFGFECITHAENEEGEVLFWLAVPPPPPFSNQERGIIDRNGDVMPESESILAHTSATEALTMPVPGESSAWYMFYLNFTDRPGRIVDTKLYYAVIDMNLRDGLGGVREINVLLDEESDLAEGMEVIALRNPCNNRFDIFSLLLFDAERGFIVRRIDTDGIHEAELALAYDPPSGFTGRGELDFHNGRVGMAFDGSGKALVFDYNPIDGRVANQVVITIVGFGFLRGPGGIEFSPDGNKVFLTRTYFLANTIYQYELASGRLHHYDYDRVAGHAELGPDGKVYIATHENLVVFEDPNASNPALTTVALGSLLDAGFGISDPVQYYDPFGPVKLPEIEIDVSEDDCACSGAVTLAAPAGYQQYEWHPGGEVTQTISVTEPGSYSVSVTNEAGCVFQSAPRTVEPTSLAGRIQIDTLKLDVGDSDMLSIRFEGPAPGTGCPPRSFRATLEFDPTVVEILDMPGPTQIDTDVNVDGQRRIVFRGAGDDVLAQFELRALAAADTYSALRLTEFAWIDCNIDISERGEGLLVAVPPMQIEGLPVLCACKSETELRGPAGLNAEYLWEPTGASTATIRIQEPGEYRLTISNDVGCVFRSDPVLVRREEFHARVSIGTVVAAPGSELALPLLFERESGPNDGPAGEGCQPQAFRATIGFNHHVLALQSLGDGATMEILQTIGEERRVRIEGSVVDTLTVLHFLALADPTHYSDVTIRDFEWLGCAADAMTIVNGAVDVSEVCVTHRLRSFAALRTLQVSGVHPLVGAGEIEFELAQGGQVRLILLNALGRDCGTLLQTVLPAGTHRASISLAGHAAGSYFLQLNKPGGSVELLRISLLE